MNEFTEKFKKEHGVEFSSNRIFEYSWELSGEFSEYFTEWWDKKKFDWHFSYRLAYYCSSDFDKWWDKEKYEWGYSHYLAQYCSSDILVWFDKEKVDYRTLDPCSIVLLKKHGKI